MTCVWASALQTNRALPLQSPDERMTKTLCCDAVAEEIGVTGVAEMASYTLKEETAFLVLATDGVWEFLTSQSVVDLVSRQGTVSSCRALQQLAGPRSGCLSSVIQPRRAAGRWLVRCGSAAYAGVSRLRS